MSLGVPAPGGRFPIALVRWTRDPGLVLGALVVGCLWVGLWAGLNAVPSEAFPLERAASPLVMGLAAVAILALAAVVGLGRGFGPVHALVAYGAIGLLASAILSPRPLEAAFWGAAYVSVPLVLVATMRWTVAPEAVPSALFRCNGVIAAVIALLLLVVALVRFDWPSLIATGTVERLYKNYDQSPASFLLINANGAGRFAAVAALLAFSRILAGGSRRRWAWALLLAPLGLLLVYTMSRSAVVGFAAALVALVFLHRGARTLAAAGGLAAVAVLATGAGPLLWAYLRRGQSLEMLATFSNRATVWWDTIALWKSSPLIGWGFQADRYLLGEHVHDAWLQALLQAGLLGALLFAVAWVWAWVAVLRAGALRRYPGLTGGERLLLVDATALLVFFTLRSVPESTAAFFGVDLLFLVPVFALFGPRTLRAAPRTFEGVARQAPSEPRRRVLMVAFACRAPGSAAFEGGEDLLGWNLARQVSRRHDVWVLTDARNESDLAAAQPIPGVTWVYVDLPRWTHGLRRRQGGLQLYAYLWQVRAAMTARRLHAALGFDLVHHVTYANDWMASHAGALLPIAFVRGPGGGAHAVPAPLRVGRGARFRLAQTARTTLQRLLRLDPFFRLGRRRAAALLVCTRESMDALPRRVRSKALVFPVNGVAADETREGIERPVGPGLSVVSAGKLIPIKGFDLSVRAFAAYVRAGGDGTLRILGDGPERDALERLASKEGVASQVHFEGWRSRADVLRAMAHGDVFLFPSMRDGGGAVVVEAMAAGLPVVCLDTAGPGLHVTDETGVRVAPAAPARVIEGLAEALLRLRDVPLRKRLGDAARKRALEHYEWDHLGERILAVYEQMWKRAAAGAVSAVHAQVERSVEASG